MVNCWKPRLLKLILRGNVRLDRIDADDYLIEVIFQLLGHLFDFGVEEMVGAFDDPVIDSYFSLMRQLLGQRADRLIGHDFVVTAVQEQPRR